MWDTVSGRARVGHWYARCHLLHIIQNSWHPLCGLSHSVIVFQKASSHISMCVCSIHRVTWVKDGSAKPSLLGGSVIKPLEYRWRTPVCSIEDVTCCDPCIRGSCHGSATHGVCFEYRGINTCFLQYTPQPLGYGGARGHIMWSDGGEEERVWPFFPSEFLSPTLICSQCRHWAQ